MRTIFSCILLACTLAAHAEGNYDPFSSKDPQERAHAANMRGAVEKGNWAKAHTFATTPALRRLYDQARREYGPAVHAPTAGVRQDRVESTGAAGSPGR